MSDPQPVSAMAEKLSLLSQCSAESLMGKLLRRFWQPVALAAEIKAGQAKPLRVLGEDLTLYRGESGHPHLVAGRCAHRLTLLHTGWVQGDDIRCMYHGWKYDGTGRCNEAPAEGPAAAARVKIAGYPLHEYCGMIFAYMGDGEAPAFDLPRKEAFERPGTMIFPRREVWPCNFFQLVENSMDAVHVSFVHQWGQVGTFGAAVTGAIPKLDYVETDAGIRQIATRGTNNVRVSDWTFPNNNHISKPALLPTDPWIDVGIWVVPVDETHTARMLIYAIPSTTPETDRRLTERMEQFGDYDPAAHHDELFNQGKVPSEVLVQLTSAQDYVAAVGQGAIVDRAHERLGKSDIGIAYLRRMVWRELDAIRLGNPTKSWHGLEHATELPPQRPVPAEA
jgi:5,5'-dehydrodivanillate O-demethylase